MPKLSRWFIKTGLLYFVISLLVALLLAASGLIEMPNFVLGLTPVYFHLFMVGWITQLIFGVANWMFPIYNRDTPRGNQRLGWATFWLLNVGLILRAISEPLVTSANVRLWGVPLWGIVLTISSLLLWIAGIVFVINTWGRVKGR